MRCRVRWVLGGLAVFLGSALAESLDPALATLESFRTDEERQLSELVAPPAKESEAWPEGTEVFLVGGYIGHDCVRIFRREGKPVVQRVKITRSWFYSPEESYTAEQWDVSEAALGDVWNLAERIRTMGLKVYPRSNDRMFGNSIQSSSHEPTFLVRIQNSNGHVRFLNAARGKSFSNGVQDLLSVQTRALARVFESLIPKDKPGETFAMEEWEPFLLGLLNSNVPDLPNRRGSDRGRQLLAEVSLQLLGQMGGPDALEAIRMAHRVEELREEAAYAETKVTLRDRFDGKYVARLVHETGRRRNPDRDFIQWLRDLYFERDADGYFEFVAGDLQNLAADPQILRESIAEVVRRYPAKQTALLEGVLDNINSEVSVEAALALLRSDPAHERAWKTLDRVAGNPCASIPADAEWSSRFGRDRALDYLVDERNQIPVGRRWTLDRVERQLQQPWEDGRMVKRLIGMRGGLAKEPVPRELQVAAYRRTLDGPLTNGAVAACEELMELKDMESVGRITAVFAALEAGCNRGLSWQEDPDAKYPWIDKYELERLRGLLEKLTSGAR